MKKNYIKNVGWWKAILYRLRLAWYLLVDERVPMLTKTVPALVMIYVLSPFDLIPVALLGLGQLDDLAVFMLARDAEGQVIDVEVINPHEES